MHINNKQIRRASNSIVAFPFYRKMTDFALVILQSGHEWKKRAIENCEQQSAFVAVNILKWPFSNIIWWWSLWEWRMENCEQNQVYEQNIKKIWISHKWIQNTTYTVVHIYPKNQSINQSEAILWWLSFLLRCVLLQCVVVVVVVHVRHTVRCRQRDDCAQMCCSVCCCCSVRARCAAMALEWDGCRANGLGGEHHGIRASHVVDVHNHVQRPFHELPILAVLLRERIPGCAFFFKIQKFQFPN